MEDVLDIRIRLNSIEDAIDLGNLILNEYTSVENIMTQLLKRSIHNLKTYESELNKMSDLLVEETEKKDRVNKIKTFFSSNHSEAFGGDFGAYKKLNENLRFANEYPALEKLVISINRSYYTFMGIFSELHEKRKNAWKDIETLVEDKCSNKDQLRQIYNKYHDKEFAEASRTKVYRKSGLSEEICNKYLDRPELEYIEVINDINLHIKENQ